MTPLPEDIQALIRRANAHLHRAATPPVTPVAKPLAALPLAGSIVGVVAAGMSIVALWRAPTPLPHDAAPQPAAPIEHPTAEWMPQTPVLPPTAEAAPKASVVSTPPRARPHRPVTRQAPAPERTASTQVTPPPAELALLVRARQAVRAGDFATASAQLAAHADLYAKGALVEDRLALWITYWQARADTARAHDAEQALRHAFPHSAYLPRDGSAPLLTK